MNVLDFIICFILSMSVANILGFLFLQKSAPFGYEDENGFHETDEPEFSLKPTLYPDDYIDHNEQINITGDNNEQSS